MAAIQRQRPHDKETWALAHHHFGSDRETAASLQADAQVAPMPCSPSYLSQTEMQLQHTCDPPHQHSEPIDKEGGGGGVLGLHSCYAESFEVLLSTLAAGAGEGRGGCPDQEGRLAGVLGASERHVSGDRSCAGVCRCRLLQSCCLCCADSH